MLTRIANGFRVALALTIAALAAPAASAQQAFVVRGTVLTQDAAHTVIDDGRVCVKDGRIAAVLRAGEALPAAFQAAPVIDTSGVILPGLINAHNHIAYNYLEMWDAPRQYTNRYQWTSPRDYKVDINFPKKLVCEPAYFNLRVEAAKYAEVKELTGGTTSIQGAPPQGSGFNRSLVRNIDFGLDADDIYQHGLAITDGRFIEEARAGGGIVQAMNQNKCGAWLIHLAEGVDAASRAEFTVLKDLGLLREETVVIHGTALEEPDFREMAAVGCDLVWSPLSNRLLYGRTTDVPAARRAGVNVSLASDWSPSGSKNVLGELKIADEIDNNEWGNVLGYRDLVDMVTINPAKALHWDDRVGRIAPGYYADIVVVDRRGDPYASVVHATDSNVSLVLVGGDPLYGDAAIMTRLKGGDCEPIYSGGGRTKRIDVTSRAEPVKGTQTWTEIAGALTRALEFNPDHMRTTFAATRAMTADAFAGWLTTNFPGLRPVRLDPVFADGDEHFFAAIKGSLVARFPYDLKRYWERAGATIGGDRPPVVAMNGVIGGLRAGSKAIIYSSPGGRATAFRLQTGTRVEVIDARQLSPRVTYYHVRGTQNGHAFDGWVSSRFVKRQ